MKKIKCGVIGVGYLGKFHAQKFAALPRAELTAVCDVNALAAHEVAQQLNTVAYSDFHQLLDKVDAVSIAATTKQHYAIAKACLLRGKHVLIEKPITETVAQAQELVALAKKHNLKLQVGHLERFNAARIALD